MGLFPQVKLSFAFAYTLSLLNLSHGIVRLVSAGIFPRSQISFQLSSLTSAITSTSIDPICVIPLRDRDAGIFTQFSVLKTNHSSVKKRVDGRSS